MMLKTCATALLLASATRATPNASARRRLQADACSADLNDDNAIDVADLLQLLASFGTSTDVSTLELSRVILIRRYSG